MINRGHTLELLEINNQIEQDKAKLLWEREVGDEQIQIELDRKRKQLLAQSDFTGIEIDTARQVDQYGDERRDTDRDHTKKDADLEHEQDKRDADLQLEKLERAQSLKDQTDDRKAKREMEELKEVNQAKLDDRKVTASMDQRQLLAEKGIGEAALIAEAEAKAKAAANDDRMEIMEKMMDRMDAKDAAKEERASAERMRMMESQEKIAGARAEQDQGRLAREEARSDQSVEHSTQQNIASAKAVGDAFRGEPNPPASGGGGSGGTAGTTSPSGGGGESPSGAAVKKCPDCGFENAAEDLGCSECGAELS